MLQLSDFKKVLLAYLKEEDTVKAVVSHKMDGPTAELVTIKGGKRGVVVAIAPGIIGWSLCNTKDTWFNKADVFNKKVGISMALKRAQIAQGLSSEGRASFYQKIPFSIAELAESMHARSFQYFGGKDAAEVPEIDDLPFQ